jgi:hypothetical protein
MGTTGKLAPIEKLVLKSEIDQPIEVELGGLDAVRNFVTTKMDLPPHTKLALQKTFYSIAFVVLKKSLRLAWVCFAPAWLKPI